MFLVTVHTTGINWDGVLANAVFVLAIVTGVGTWIQRSIRRTIRDEVKNVIATDVTPALDRINTQIQKHDTRIARLEGVEEGKRLSIGQAGLTSH